MSEPRGLCYSCGMRELSLRLDKKGRPWLLCGCCGTRIFCRGDGAAFKWLARACLDAKDTAIPRAVLTEARAVQSWADSRFGGILAPVVASVFASKEE